MMRKTDEEKKCNYPHYTIILLIRRILILLKSLASLIGIRPINYAAGKNFCTDEHRVFIDIEIT